MKKVKNKKIQKDKLIIEYKSLKKQFIQMDHNETLEKWKILSKAYKLGKEIKGVHYSLSTLSIDFDIPYTTVKRILSLDKANENTWNKINNNKITSFKAAQILMSYDTDEQDDIIDKVIKEKLSTYQIKMLRVKDKIISSDTSRKYRNFEKVQTNIKKLILLLDMNHREFTSDKLDVIKKDLEELKYKINKFIAGF